MSSDVSSDETPDIDESEYADMRTEIGWRSEVVRFSVPGGGSMRYVAHRTISEGGGREFYQYRVASGGDREGLACVMLTCDDVDRNDHAKRLHVHLDTLHHYGGCAVTDGGVGGLEKGWSEYMAKAAIRRTLELLPNVETFSLQDESYTLCGRSEESFGEGEEAERMTLKAISLAAHNMMIHGDTWYARKLGAEPADAGCVAAVGAWKAYVGSPAPSSLAEAVRRMSHQSGLEPHEFAIVKAAVEACYADGGETTARSWKDVYGAVNKVAGGCRLFGKLTRSARVSQGLPPLHGQMFSISPSVVRSWRPIPRVERDVDGASSALTWAARGGGGSADAGRVVDGVFNIMARLRTPVLANSGNKKFHSFY